MQLTQREFLFLDDLLHEEALEVKKFWSCAQQCNDPQLGQLLNSLADKHQQHFGSLMQIVNQAHGKQQTSYQGQPYSQYSQ